MKLLKADYDCVIRCTINGLSIHLARIPDRELAAAIYALTENPGIEIPEDSQNPRPIFSSESVIHKPDRQRLYYWVDVPPVYEIRWVGNVLAHHIKDEHHLSVKIIADISPDDPFDKALVLKP